MKKVGMYLMKNNGERTNFVYIMMTKQALLEYVLDMCLTQKQIDVIENDWKAFYNNPMQYKNSVVVDMVKLSLKEV